MMWLVAATLTVVAIGLAGGAVGLLAGGLAVVAMLASGLTIAHLRAATPHAGGRRPAIVVTSQRARRVAVTGAVTLVALVALLGVAFLPPTITEASPRLVSWLSEFAFDAETPSPWFPPDEEGEQVSEGGDEGGTLEEPVMRDRVSGEGDIPVWPLPVILAALLLWLIIYLVRAGRWREVWAAILEWLRAGGDRRRRDDEFDALEALERVETARSSWSDRFDRFRPRPRDPRGAILHDYLRAERALARHELGRDGWETLFEHADRSGLGKQHRELARLASDARYGRPEPSESDSVRSRELSRSLIRAIKDRRPAEQPAGG